MSVTACVSAAGEVVEIQIVGRFDFSLQKAFRATYRDCPPGMVYRVDLSGVDYLDSAALGMLLLLRQHAGEVKQDVVLVQPTPSVAKILRIANFHQIFDVDQA